MHGDTDCLSILMDPEMTADDTVGPGTYILFTFEYLYNCMFLPNVCLS
jgi:hypothetical protein